MTAPPDIPYAPIARHGVVGDRRAAAMVAADGTIDWLCLPNYADFPVFGALLDADRGGAWRLGPSRAAVGRQTYRDRSAMLVTTWDLDAGTLELTDGMAWPWDNRGEADGGGDARVLIRRLRCVRGEADCALVLRPRRNFNRAAEVRAGPNGTTFAVGDLDLRLWTDRPLTLDKDSATGAFRLRAGEDAWFVLSAGDDADRRGWSATIARDELARADRYWRDWWERLRVDGPRADRVRRSALTVHLLSFAPTGSPVAAPTTSLPERTGGDRNYDYRYAWVRDASLVLATLARLGDTGAGQRYMDCLTTYRSSTDSPLQIDYGVDGAMDLPVVEWDDLAGYRGSRPVRVGNRACGQRQLDSLGHFVECALTFLEEGGEWRDRYWEMVRRAADYTADTWREPDSGIGESGVEAQYVSSKMWLGSRSTAPRGSGSGSGPVPKPWAGARQRPTSTPR